MIWKIGGVLLWPEFDEVIRGSGAIGVVEIVEIVDILVILLLLFELVL
jgi:hypothetical protein